jgi:transposase-like protein
MPKYSPAFKERVVREYQPRVRGKGFAALATKFPGPSSTLIQKWWRKWTAGGRTVEAFEPEAGRGRRSILTEKEKEKHILKFVIHKNVIGEPVDYKEVHENVISKTGKDISLTRVQAIGNDELDLSWKQGTLVTASVETTDFKESVAKYRRKCQHLSKEKLIFIDGTGMKAGARRTHGLAPRGKKARIKTNKAAPYQPRVDMWGAISYNKPLAFDLKTSKDRRKEGVKGYRKKHLKLFLRKKVAPKIAHLPTKVILNMDRGFKCKPGELLNELKSGGAKNVEDVWIFPPDAGKLCNPLDNTLWHSLKDRVRKKKPDTEEELAKIAKKEFMNISAKDLHSYFRNCGLTYGSDLYKDL